MFSPRPKIPRTLIQSKSVEVSEDWLKVVTIMRFSWLVGFSILLESVIYADAHPPDYVEKDWMDRCDLKRLKTRPTETTTTTIKTTQKRMYDPLLPEESGPGSRFYKVNDNPKIDVSARQAEVIRELKRKVIIDAAERGTSADLDGYDTDPRSFAEEYYQYDN